MSSIPRPLSRSANFFVQVLTHERLILGLIVIYLGTCMALLSYLRHEALQAIEQAALSEAHETARDLLRAAHKLKGGSQSICADQVVRLAQAVEYGAASFSEQSLEVAVSELRSGIAECTGYLREAMG